MKIRTDFVTNSSSSNYTVTITITTLNKQIQIKENPEEYVEAECGSAMFIGDLRDINSHLSSVEELATWLVDSIEMELWHGQEPRAFKRNKIKFIEEARSEIDSVKDIETITVEHRYDAWGEYADLAADNDSLLGLLAQNYLQSSGIEKERAEAELVTYIHTATDVFFGIDSQAGRYRWDGCSLDKIAKRILSNVGPDSVSGTARKELNMRTGEYFDVSDFDLS